MNVEHALRELSAQIEFPETPDLAGAVSARLAEPSRRPSFLSRRALAVALAVLALAIGLAFAVPPARTAILRFFHVGHVKIELVEKVPSTPVGRPLALGTRVSLAEARRRARFRLLVPPTEPDAVYVRGGFVSLLYGSEEHPRVLITEFAGGWGAKAGGPGTLVTGARVRGHDGYWIAGKPHRLDFFDRFGRHRVGVARLAGNTLLWAENGATYRIEGKLTEGEALELARSLR